MRSYFLVAMVIGVGLSISTALPRLVNNLAFTEAWRGTAGDVSAIQYASSAMWKILALAPTPRLESFNTWLSNTRTRSVATSEPVRQIRNPVVRNDWKLATARWEPKEANLYESGTLVLTWESTSLDCVTDTPEISAANTSITTTQMLSVTGIIPNGNFEWWYDPSVRPLPQPWRFMLDSNGNSASAVRLSTDPFDEDNRVLEVQNRANAETILYTEPNFEAGKLYLFLGSFLSLHPVTIAVMELDATQNRWPLVINTESSAEWLTYAGIFSVADPVNSVLYFALSESDVSSTYVDDMRVVELTSPSARHCH